jgi:CBS domain-containing protein
MKIKELMTRDPASCGPADSLNEAARLMWERDCGAIPVVDEGRVVAIVTDRDVCMAAYTRGQRLSEIPVETVMSDSLVVCREDDSVNAVESVMREHQIRRLPVTDDRGGLRGVISLNDLALAAQHGGKSGDEQGVARTLAAICEHRQLSAVPRAAE